MEEKQSRETNHTQDGLGVLVEAFEGMCVGIMYVMEMASSRNDHTIMTALLPVCSAKLSMIWLR